MEGAAMPRSPPRSAARACPTGPAPLWAVRGASGPGSVTRATRASEERARTKTPRSARRPTPVPSTRFTASAFLRDATSCFDRIFFSGRGRLAAMTYRSLAPEGAYLLRPEAAVDCRARSGGGQFSSPVPWTKGPGMDVRCERCKTLYELDDARVSEAGTTVRCTTCGHVFRVRKKVLLMTEPVGAGGESTAVPPPVSEKPAWRVRSPSGRVIAFRELTSMQKWIVERKFGRDDEISLHGDHWKRLGDIAELQPFFLLLDEVDRVHELEERLRKAELPDEAPPLLERELGFTSPAPTPDPSRPIPTPIRLETPIDPPPEPPPAWSGAFGPETGGEDSGVPSDSADTP